MKRVMRWFMISCQKAGQLIEKRLHHQITPAERIELIVHTSLCQACRTYEKQSRVIEKAMLKSHGAKAEKAPDKLKQSLHDKFK